MGAREEIGENEEMEARCIDSVRGIVGEEARIWRRSCLRSIVRDVRVSREDMLQHSSGI
jgi:hypothetical protein